MRELEESAHRFLMQCEAEDETRRIYQHMERYDWTRNIREKKVEKIGAKSKLKVKDRKKNQMAGKGAKRRKDKRDGKKDIVK